VTEETPRRAPWRFPRRSILTGSSLLVGLVPVVDLIEAGAANRSVKGRLDEIRGRDNSKHREDNQQRGGKEETKRNDGKDESNKHDKNEDKQSDKRNGKDADSRDDDRQSRKDEESSRERSGNDDSSTRQGQRRQAQQGDSSSQSQRDGGNGGGDWKGRKGRRSQRFLQEADLAQTTSPPTSPPGSPPPTSTSPTSIVPDLSSADLVVQGNPNVIAGVSSRGGFAFARSGDVTAFTGPDGAVIIQTDEVSTTSPPPPPPPTEGGDNNTDFTS
jgi:hypothetical protein